MLFRSAISERAEQVTPGCCQKQPGQRLSSRTEIASHALDTLKKRTNSLTKACRPGKLRLAGIRGQRQDCGRQSDSGIPPQIDRPTGLEHGRNGRNCRFTPADSPGFCVLELPVLVYAAQAARVRVRCGNLCVSSLKERVQYVVGDTEDRRGA